MALIAWQRSTRLRFNAGGESSLSFRTVERAGFFEPVGSETAVTWTLPGYYNFVTEAMELFINMDQMIGGDLEAGLANLEAIVAGQSQPRAACQLAKT